MNHIKSLQKLSMNRSNHLVPSRAYNPLRCEQFMFDLKFSRHHKRFEFQKKIHGKTTQKKQGLNLLVNILLVLHNLYDSICYSRNRYSFGERVVRTCTAPHCDYQHTECGRLIGKKMEQSLPSVTVT